MTKPRWRALMLALLLCALAAPGASVHALTLAGPGTAPAQLPEPTAGGPRIYAYYYMWWNRDHWHDRLGPNYPYQRDKLPLPATLERGGCGAESKFRGNQLFDVPAHRLWSQDNPGLIERDVRLAANAGLAGFLANWHGTGESGQEIDDTGYTERLDALIDAVEEVNAEGKSFKLWLNYKASSKHRSLEFMSNDLRFIENRYGASSVWDHNYSNRIMLVWGGSRKYSADRLETIARRFRDTFFILGDENDDTWTPTRAQSLDGNQYYWSSQNPYSNPHSFDQLQELADEVRSSGDNPDGSKKLWFAPLTPGYNSELLRGGSCVPRRGGRTLRSLFEGNSQSDPDGWTLISWNEIAEGTHVRPLKRWGRYYLNAVADLTRP